MRRKSQPTLMMIQLNMFLIESCLAIGWPSRSLVNLISGRIPISVTSIKGRLIKHIQMASEKSQTVDPRQDIQLQKVSIYFTGWAFDPKFNYFLYVWTTNASQGQGAQVVVAGNLSYNFSKHFRLTGGIMALPGVRSTEGNYPFWLSVDNRMIADEYMRPSYTSGIQVRGEIVKKLTYQSCLETT